MPTQTAYCARHGTDPTPECVECQQQFGLEPPAPAPEPEKPKAKRAPKKD